MEQETWKVKEEGVRLDKALAKLDETLSRVAVKRLIEEGKVLVNGKTQKASYLLKKGDEVVLQKEEPKEVNGE